MARNPSYTVSATVVDQSGEKGLITINTAAAVDISTGLPTLYSNFLTAVETELLAAGLIVTQHTAGSVRRADSALVGFGNREDKVELKYVDTVTFRVYTMELPCRRADLATVPGSDLIPEATWADTKTAFDAFVRSPDGNAVSLQQVRLIGRNS